VRQVGYLQRLYRDARSTEHNRSYQIFAGDYESDSKVAGAWSWFPTYVSSKEIINAWSHTYISPYILISLCLKKHKKNLAERMKFKYYVRDDSSYLLKNLLFIHMSGLNVNHVNTNMRLKLTQMH